MVNRHGHLGRSFEPGDRQIEFVITTTMGEDTRTGISATLLTAEQDPAYQGSTESSGQTVMARSALAV